MNFQYPKTLPLWKEKWSKHQLLKKFEEGPREFRRGFRLDAMSDDERMLPHFDMAVEAGRGLTVETLLMKETPTIPFMGGDPGGTGRSGSREGAALFVLGLNQGQRIPLDVRFGNWSPKQWVENAVELYQRWMPAVVYVENNGLQEAYLELMRSMPGTPVLPLWGFLTGANKSDPTIGIEGLDSEFIQGRWTIPSAEFYDHEVGCSCHWCRWYAEVANYPNYSSTDGVMSMWFSWQALRKGDAMNTGKAMATGELDLGMPEVKTTGVEEKTDLALHIEEESWDIDLQPRVCSANKPQTRNNPPASEGGTAMRCQACGLEFDNKNEPCEIINIPQLWNAGIGHLCKLCWKDLPASIRAKVKANPEEQLEFQKLRKHERFMEANNSGLTFADEIVAINPQGNMRFHQIQGSAL